MTWETLSLPEDNDRASSWPTAEDCARKFNTSRRSFERSAQEAGIPRYKDGRSFRFDPEDLDGLAIEKEPSISDAPTAALLQQAYIHNEKLMALTLDLVTGEVKQLRERCGMLEQGHTELIKAREEALNEATERAALVSQVQNEDKRKTEALSKMFELGKQAIGNKITDSRVGKFLESITAQQLELATMLGAEMWTPEQLAFLEKLKDSKPKPVTEEKKEE